MPLLRDLYPGSKKSTSAYLPAYSLSIAPQLLSRHPAETTCITLSSELQYRPHINEKRFPSGIGESSPKTGREAFLTT